MTLTYYSKSVSTISGATIKCWQCNSKYDPRCGEPFNNHSIAFVDCDQQRSLDIPHLDDKNLAFYNRDTRIKYGGDDEDAKGVEKKDQAGASLCRKTTQTGDTLQYIIGCSH